MRWAVPGLKMSLFDGKRAVLFDLGGTLIEFENEPWDELERKGMRKCHELLNRNGYDVPSADEFANLFVEYHAQKWKEIMKDNKEVPFHRLVAEFLDRYDIGLGENISEFVRTFYSPITEQLHRRKGAIQALEFVKTRELKIGLVSNSPFPADWHRDEMRRFEIYDYFDCTVFSSELGIRKPEPSIFRECLGKLGVAVGEAIHIGDRAIEDIAGAKSLGIASVLVSHANRDVPPGIRPDRTIRDLRELPSL